MSRSTREKEAVMNRTRSKRMTGLIAVVLVMTSFLVIGCGDSPTAPLVADDGDGGQVVRPRHTGGGNIPGKGDTNDGVTDLENLQ